MTLEESVDCDGTCSSLDPIGCRLVSHEECNREFDEAIARLPSDNYSGLRGYIQRRFSAIKNLFYNLGF